MRRKNLRKSVIVDRAVQARIVLETSLPMIGCLVFALFVEMFYRYQVTIGNVDPTTRIMGFPIDRLSMLLFFVSASTMHLASALNASQKVAGASYRIAKTLREYRSGDTSIRVRLRDGDYHFALADDVNDFLDWVQRGAQAENSSVAYAQTDADANGAATAWNKNSLPGKPEPAPAHGLGASREGAMTSGARDAR